MKRQMTPISEVKKINSVSKARAYLGRSQSELGLMLGCDQAVVSKVEHGKMRYNSMQVERLAIAVALEFRKRIGYDNIGLWHSYNSPLAFKVGKICRNHRKPVEFEIKRVTDRCPKCKA